MNRRIALLLLGAAALAALLGALRSSATDEPALARFAPPGAMLYLEARDFSSLLGRWNGSKQKPAWLGSSDYEVFSRSRLFLRLKEAGDQFAAAAGLPPDMVFVSQAAGSQSAVALYDIGKLQFLYITRMPPGQAERSALVASRAKFEARTAAGTTFYYRKQEDTGREVAFATTGEYLVLATREDLMAGALTLISGGKDPSVASEAWWTRSVAAAGQPGDLRLVLNLEKIVPSPYFRSYWVQRNITDMKAFSAAISDLRLSGSEFREERVLLKKDAGAAGASGAGSAAVAALAQMVPADAGVYVSAAHPSGDACLALLESKLLAPHPGPGVASQTAPQVQLSSGQTGGSGDMETRIDQAPFDTGSLSATPGALKSLLAKNPVEASLSFESTDTEKDGVFVRLHTAVILLGSADWDDAAVRAAIAEFVRPMYTAGGLGAAWRQQSGYQELDGLWPLAVAVRGKYLILSDDARWIREIGPRTGQSADVQPALWIAGFNHARERQPFLRLVHLLDIQAVSQTGAGRQPEFFSENMASLSNVLSKVASEKVVARDAGDKVLQTVIYEWAE